MSKHWLIRRIQPLLNKNFRSYFLVQSLSQVGRWSQELAKAWIILEISPKATLLGFAILSSALPSLLFMLWGGSNADHRDPKKTLLLTQSLLGLTSLSLAYLAYFGHIQIWHIVVIGFLEGAIRTFDSPAYQVMIAKIIPKDQLQQAISLNMTNFHFGRMLGPSLAAILLTWKGPAFVFLFDGISYFFLVYIVFTLVVSPHSSKSKNQGALRAFFQGIGYIFYDNKIRFTLLQLFINVSVILPLGMNLYRTFFKSHLGLSAEQFGFLFSFPAFGAFTSTLLLTLVPLPNPMLANYISLPLLAALVFYIPSVDSFHLAASSLFLSGFLSSNCLIPLTITLHTKVSDPFRGRIGSLITLSFFCIGPFMSFPFGMLADSIQPGPTMKVLSLLFVIFTLANWLCDAYLKKKIPSSQKNHP